MSALFIDPKADIAYLGPEGSFSHLVAQQRFPDPQSQKFFKPFRTVPEIFEYIDENENARGIVPIENSSGGMILPTVDGLIEHAVRDACSLFIQEELSLNVRLSLLGKTGRQIDTIYSHFAPLQHCEQYLNQNYPAVRQVPCSSTAVAAEEALRDPCGAAIAPAVSAERFGLDVLEGHLLKNVTNVTQFFLVGKDKHDSKDGKKTSLVIALPNTPGSLVDFLFPWKKAGINLTRIESRPIMGQPNTYRFLIELVGISQDPVVRSAMEEAKAQSQSFSDIGSYPVLPRYES